MTRQNPQRKLALHLFSQPYAFWIFTTVFFSLLGAQVQAQAQTETKSRTITFAAIGDFGNTQENLKAVSAVASLVKSWNPDFIITLGDNNYPSGEAKTIDSNIGRFYHE